MAISTKQDHASALVGSPETLWDNVFQDQPHAIPTKYMMLLADVYARLVHYFHEINVSLNALTLTTLSSTKALVYVFKAMMLSMVFVSYFQHAQN